MNINERIEYDKKKFLENCIKRRQELGYSQSQLAKIMDATQQNISSFELGKTNARLNFIVRYLACLGLDINDAIK